MRFLDVVLSLPRALKELHVGERLHVFDEKPSLNPKDRTSDPLFLAAIHRQSDSLERLVHIAGDVRYLHRDGGAYVEGDFKLCDLKALTYLETGWESCLSQFIMQNRCPESLKTLRMADHAMVPTQHDHTSTILGYAFSKMNLQTRPLDLELLFNHNVFRDVRYTLRRNWTPPSGFPKRKFVYSLAKLLKSRGSRLRIFAEKFKHGKSFIAPYMYGEDTPVEELLYDSDKFWTFMGVDHQSYDEELLEKPELVDEFVRLHSEPPDPPQPPHGPNHYVILNGNIM